jgi:hypothetical protein
VQYFSGLHGCITWGESSFIVKTSVMSFGVSPTSIPRESKIVKLNIATFLQETALQMHPMMQRQSKMLFGVLHSAEESG